jgi:hypothetical protein
MILTMELSCVIYARIRLWRIWFMWLNWMNIATEFVRIVPSILRVFEFDMKKGNTLLPFLSAQVRLRRGLLFPIPPLSAGGSRWFPILPNR